MLESLTDTLARLVYVPEAGMVHPGLPVEWVLAILLLMAGLLAASLRPLVSGAAGSGGMAFPLYRGVFSWLLHHKWILLSLRIVMAAIFLLVIVAGLFGTPVPERNLATMLTWTIWWSAVVISVFFIGTAWCAVCPWDSIAGWLVRRRLWRRGSASSSLGLRVPRSLRNIWPALWMFIGLTWLELGIGVTVSPYATALLALLMVVLATISLAVYERKAFCRYFCAVGRTLGAYTGMSPLALRPIDQTTCNNCKTLECFHGTADIEPCPTHLVMGSLSQSTYCTSCGACVQSCPHQNVAWQVRPVGSEIVAAARPHRDEAWFALGLLALTLFHGFTMMPYWEGIMSRLAMAIGDSGRLLTSFTLGMIVSILLIVGLYVATVWLVRRLARIDVEYWRVFAALAFINLPLAFSFHLAHNLNHLVREAHGFWSVVANPLGEGTLPLSMGELHMRHMNPLLSGDVVATLQSLLVLFGFWLALRIARVRMARLCDDGRSATLAVIPAWAFILVVSLSSLWLLMQPMVMRM